MIINAHNFGGGSYDTDAAAYIAAVETADGTSLGTKYADAINDFVVGAKADGFWSAIKAACFLAGPATLAGALVPLVGTAPTNTGFVSGDYAQGVGLTGDSSSYIDTNRAGNADPQNNVSNGVWMANTRIGSTPRYISGVAASRVILGNPSGFRVRANSATLRTLGSGSETSGLVGMSRANSSNYDWRYCSESGNQTDASVTPTSNDIHVYADPGGANASNTTLAFYWVGEALSLTDLSARLATYTAAIA